MHSLFLLSVRCLPILSHIASLLSSCASVQLRVLSSGHRNNPTSCRAALCGWAFFFFFPPLILRLNVEPALAESWSQMGLQCQPSLCHPWKDSGRDKSKATPICADKLISFASRLCGKEQLWEILPVYHQIISIHIMLLTFYPILSHCALENTTAYWMDFYNALWYQSLWYVTIQYGTIRCHVMWYDTKLCALSPQENLSWTLVLRHLTAHTMAERHHTVFVKRIFLIQQECFYIAPNIIGTELQMMSSISSFWIIKRAW